MQNDQGLYSITRPRGFRAAGGTCGIKPSGKPDLALIVSDQPASGAAVFTENAFVGAPVTVGREHLKAARGKLRALVINSGRANVATGQAGLTHARRMCQAVARAGGAAFPPEQVLPASTGVIGQPLPIDRITRGVTDLWPTLTTGPAADAAAARAILTTDLRAKAAHRIVRLGKSVIQLGGIAKGSGMIAPHMATMLAFLTTDAAIAPTVLRKMLIRAVNADASFNRITVDSDTSTSDTVAVLANGAADAGRLTPGSRYGEHFAAALTELCQDLAYQIIQDGEGLEHVIRVTARGAAGPRDAERIARSVADSPLVKTAVHGRDPNWGRIVMAVGKAGAAVDPGAISVRVAGTRVFQQGKPTKFDAAKLSDRMNQPEVLIEIDLAAGDAACTILGCDLTREYIRINADYTT